jgi:hypothetical protein
MTRCRRLGPVAALALLSALAACSATPFETPPSDDAAQAVPGVPALAGVLGPFDYDPRPRAVALCYGSFFSRPREVMEHARELCPYGGEVERADDDFFWNDCPLLLPQRASFVCTPGPAPAPKYK